jgi:hypothetical protein
MSQDQIQLPEPDGYVWCDEFEGGCFAYAHDVRPTSATSVFNANTVRSLIASAVAAERAKNIAAMEALNRWDYDDPASSAIAAIQGDQT